MDQQLAVFLNNGKDNDGDIIIVSSDDEEILCHSIVVQLMCSDLTKYIENRYKNKDDKDDKDDKNDNDESMDSVSLNNDKDDKCANNNNKQNNGTNKRRKISKKISKKIYKKKIHLDYSSKVIIVFLNKMYDSKYKINTLNCYEMLELIKLLDEFTIVNKNETIAELEKFFSEQIDVTNWLSLLYDVLNDTSYAFLLKIIREYFISVIESSNGEQADKLMSSLDNMDSKSIEIYKTCNDWYKMAVRNLRQKSNILSCQHPNKQIIDDTIKKMLNETNMQELSQLNNKLRIMRGNHFLMNDNIIKIMDNAIKSADDKLKSQTSQNNNQNNKQENTVGVKLYTPAPFQLVQKQSQQPYQIPQKATMPPIQQKVVNRTGPQRLLIPPTQSSPNSHPNQLNQMSQVMGTVPINIKSITQPINLTNSVATSVDLTSQQK